MKYRISSNFEIGLFFEEEFKAAFAKYTEAYTEDDSKRFFLEKLQSDGTWLLLAHMPHLVKLPKEYKDVENSPCEKDEEKEVVEFQKDHRD